MTLSDRIRANSEAAPWVIEEVVKMESEIERLTNHIKYLNDLRKKDKAEIEKLREALLEQWTRVRIDTDELRALLAEGRDIIACIATAEQGWLGQANAALDQTTIKQPSSNGEVK
jgi:predicted RNase H-like nuclease (RuvC/YqgF family)